MGVPPLNGNNPITINAVPAKINVDIKQVAQEDQEIESSLKKHPKDYVLVIFKSSKRLYICKDGQVMDSRVVKKSQLDSAYAFLKGSPDDQFMMNSPVPINLGRAPKGRKRLHNDKKTPEGEYFICRKDGPGRTAFSAALTISYPNLSEAQEARDKGIISVSQYHAIKNIIG